MLRRYSDRLELSLGRLLTGVRDDARRNLPLLAVLGAVAVAGYGYDLFNLNLTIDEEVHATYPGPTLRWIEQGRWGMYVLNSLLLPHTVLPFVPLFVALFFEIAALLLLLRCWGVLSRWEQCLAGAVALAFPGMAYIYTFSTINYGIGFGLFCAALSLFIYIRTRGVQRWLAVFPAAFALAIYQGFVPALAAVYLVYVIAAWRRDGKIRLAELALMASIQVLAVAVYYLIQRAILLSGVVSESAYVAEHLDTAYFFNNSGLVFGKLGAMLAGVYGGDKSIYSIQIGALGILIALSALAFFLDVFRRRNLSAASKGALAALLLVLLALPFAGGVLLRGDLVMRYLVGLPVALGGLIMLGFGSNPRALRLILGLLAVACIFQFAVSTNRLFGASNLALQADRLLASRLITRIDEAQAEQNIPNPQYLEMVGYPQRTPTELIPKLDTFGASFFEWDEGNTGRVVLFLQTIGYTQLLPLPLARRIQMTGYAEAMPAWPQKGSVQIIVDTVLVKFGAYSPTQKSLICQGLPAQSPATDQAFCS